MTKPRGLTVGSWVFIGVFLVLALVVLGTSGGARWSWVGILLLAFLPIVVFASRRAASRRRCVESGPSLTGC
jgi:Flp pilus assembly protein TadB